MKITDKMANLTKMANAATKALAMKKLAHALKLKTAEAPFMPPASAVTMPAPKPKAPKAPAGPGLRMAGKTTGKIMRGSDGTPMGPAGRPMMVGGGQPIYAKVKPKARPQPKMPVPPNNLKAQYVKN